ncbi:PAS domain S-box-containing protein [Arsukibacterium tuosuense]|uniref:histidine kinase n=1 Tax=Arsukibacterium tuosuense TaxID=1323745 RepID=A0A285IDP0_9GAMM|nr:PAS domain S-box protein [Arsukibacterium tuosuense]SNY45907.1 PAS domain S-box-containing protein [Arsukibacterium tuosuense]
MNINLLSNHSALFSSFFYDNPEPMWLYERTTLKYLAVNNAAIQKYGYSEQEFLAMTIADIRPAEDLPALQATIAGGSSGCKKAGVWRHLTKSGKVLFVEITSHLTAIDGTDAVMVCARDVTRQLKLESENYGLLQAEKNQREQLERSSRLLAIASRSGRLGGWRVDLETNQAQWSEQTAAIHGFSQPQTMPAEQAINFYAPAYRQLVKERFNRCAQYGTGYDEICQLIDLHGNALWVRAIGEAEYDDKGQIVAVQGAFQDVDELIRTKDQLAEVQQDLYDTLEQISDAFFLLDDNWRFIFINRTAEQLLRKPKRNLLDKNVWHCYPEAVGSVFQQQYELAATNKVTVQFDEYFAPLDCHFDVTAYPTHNGLAVYFRDISRQKQLAAQLERSTNLQQQAQQLDALAKLTGGIAHDFNNLFTVIISNTELLTETLQQQPAALKSAQLCLQAAQKATNLTRHLLAFGRRQLLKPEKLSLAVLVESAIPLLRHALNDSIELSWQQLDEQSMIELDKEHFSLALLSLVINAREAMPHGGKIVLTTEPALPEVFTQYKLTQPYYVQLRVTDNGPGMADNVRQKAFEPFFTTKMVGEGFGLGLSFVYGFMQQSGGTAYIDDNASKGCSICLLIPVHTAAAQTANKGSLLQKDRLLLVEDDELLLQHLTVVLQRAGYDVMAVPTADEAKLQIEHHHFNYIFSDIVTPGAISGSTLAHLASTLQPDIKILLTSGYSGVGPHEQGAASPFSFIAKPYNTAELLARIANL